MHKFIKYFYFHCNSFFGTFILVFCFHGNVLLFKETLFAYYKHSETLRTSLLSLLFIIEIPTFSKFWALLYPIFLMEGTWKPVSKNN